MSKVFWILGILVLGAAASFAQGPEYPKVDFTAGYTLNFSDLKGNIILGRQTFHGFTVAPAVNINKNFGIEADVTYTTKRLSTAVSSISGPRVNLFSYMGGPRFTARPANKKLQPFVHALFGGAHATVQVVSENGFATKLGGGLDVVASKHVAIRAFQGDYYLTRFAGRNSNNFVLTFGVRLF
jgi:hypothetical protein